MKLNRVGFFKEFSFGETTDPSLMERISEIPDDLEGIIRYIQNGNPMVVAPCTVYDILATDNIPIRSLAILTDGIWEWPSVFAYYIENYNVIIPIDFIQHIRENGYKCQELTKDELIKLIEIENID